MAGEISSTRDKVRAQYNRYPYPRYSWLARCQPLSSLHVSYETGAALTQRKLISSQNKKIGLLGCGTFEPYILGSIHKNSSISAVDLSTKSLNKAKRRCLFRGIKNVHFYESDLIEFCSLHPQSFDYIYCYGVLHHLDNPQAGFNAISTALSPSGFARIMVYSATQRRRQELLRQGALVLGLSAHVKNDANLTRKLIACLPWEHPLKITALMNSDNETDEGLVDSTLHVSQTSFTLSALQDKVKMAGLHLVAWDFSPSASNLLANVPGATLNERIEFLEAFDQWPTSFTFWVSKKPLIDTAFAESLSTALTVHPLVSQSQKPWKLNNFFSSPLRQSPLRLNSFHIEILNLCNNRFEIKSKFKEPELKAAIADLLQCRFLLEVNP